MSDLKTRIAQVENTDPHLADLMDEVLARIAELEAEVSQIYQAAAPLIAHADKTIGGSVALREWDKMRPPQKEEEA